MDKTLTAPDEVFWEDLLTFIDSGCVIPVLGQGAVTFGEDDQPLYPWITRRLGEALGLSASAEGSTLNDIVCRHLLSGGSLNLVYLRLSQILQRECPTPGPTMRALAEVDAFRLLLTTTPDPLLSVALDETRFGGRRQTTVGAFAPEADHADLPARLADLTGPHVHHLLGKVSPKPDYVVWDEDALEFACALHRRIEKLENLARDLHQHSLLVLGMHFSDWLVRFILRIAKQRRLSQINDHLQYLAEGTLETLPDSMVLFFGGLRRNITVIPTTPASFIAELSRRWRAKHSTRSARAVQLGAKLPEASGVEGAIFLSYAREDEAAARQLKSGLERAGCIVWFDRERLKSGAHWHAHLEGAVRKHCAFFVSVISRHTEATAEAYFHLERNWAADRIAHFAEDEEFYFPVVIDDSSLNALREPRVAKLRQAVRLFDGVPSAEFAERIFALQQIRLANRSKT